MEEILRQLLEGQNRVESRLEGIDGNEENDFGSCSFAIAALLRKTNTERSRFIENHNSSRWWRDSFIPIIPHLFS
ncbi:hypothetical protein [Pelosinus baikalensis]|uniref:Uncharacterized protein n=1 Tax=Pelosinus baikalensis TaxID=2892015 RepID=A0ABS8HLR6_9FIRM|nr:hypothetical protein [Pelosinus baikalensis]MCC5464121.1 hypothetical protein [Pelosinus baikalensis]